MSSSVFLDNGLILNFMDFTAIIYLKNSCKIYQSEILCVCSLIEKYTFNRDNGKNRFNNILTFFYTVSLHSSFLHNFLFNLTISTLYKFNSAKFRGYTKFYTLIIVWLWRVIIWLVTTCVLQAKDFFCGIFLPHFKFILSGINLEIVIIKLIYYYFLSYYY